MRSPPYPDKENRFIYFVGRECTLSDKVGESGIRVGGGVRFLDIMQLQERQYI